MRTYKIDESLIFNEIVKLIESEEVNKKASIHTIHTLLNLLEEKGEEEE